MTTTATAISLEPLLQAFSSTSIREPGPSKQDGVSLAIRLQRLWQERGDFSHLTAESLREEQAKEEKKKQDVQDTKAEDEVLEEKQDGQELEGQAEGDEQSQTMSPDELWELKSNMLQGLGLARNDITSALDLLQLLLNPLGALNPPVPEEALALPSGSLSTSSLHVPLPAPSEHIHLSDTALPFSTKAKAIDTASAVLRNASKRLDRTTNTSQVEWTDLLRLKRSGQWRIEARGAAPGISRDFSSGSRIQVDKLAKDLCVFCGVEEAKIQWRQAGLARLRERDKKGKGKEREQNEVFQIPERLEGRRRLAIKLAFHEVEEELVFFPALDDATEDMHATLSQAQREIFEEELFGELIHEARESNFRISATRNALDVSTSDAFKISFEMISIDDLPSTSSERAKTASVLPQLLSAICRLKMVQTYKRRRRELRHFSSSLKAKAADAPKPILDTLLDLVTYYQHSSSIESLFQTLHASLAALHIFDDDQLYFDFARIIDSADDIVSSISKGDIHFGGLATYTLGERSINLTFSSPSNLMLHLPSKDIRIANMDELCLYLGQAVRAALLQQTAKLLKDVAKDQEAWEVLPIPAVVQKSTRALARKSSEGLINEFISVLPVVTLTHAANATFECTVTLEAAYSRRANDTVTRKIFSSKPVDEEQKAGLRVWLQERLV